MGWTNPRWGSLVGPDADTLRNIFQSLSEWTNNPSFGYATNPTISGGGVQVAPTSLTVKNEWIQSAGFVSGSAGWQIKADGDAEFNNITIRGIFKTASTGRRVEIGTSGDATSVKLFNGSGSETQPARITTEFTSGFEAFKIYGAQMSGGNRAVITLFDKIITMDGRLQIFSIGTTTQGAPLLNLSSGAGMEAMSVTGHVRLNSGSQIIAEGAGTFGEAKMGTWTGAGGHAKFSHRDRFGSTELGFFQRWDGFTWVGSAGSLQFERDGRVACGYIDGNGFFPQNQLVMQDRDIILRNWNDGNHFIDWRGIAGGGDGVYIGGYYGVTLWSIVAAAEAGLQQDGNFVLYDNGSAWGMKSIPSALNTKNEVKTLEPGSLEKVKKMRPVSFKRKYTDSRQEKKQKFDEADAVYQEAASTLPIVPQPLPKEVYEAWRDWDIAEKTFGEGGRLHPDKIPTEIGFVAEEVAKIEPRAVFAESGDVPMSIPYGQLTALTVGAMQELEQRVAALETFTKILEKT